MSHDAFTPTGDESLALRALEIMRRRWLLAAAASAAVLASAVSFALYLPDLYTSSALVLVERPVSESFVRTAVSGELESRLHVIKQEILSRDRLTELIDRFDLYPAMRRRASMEDVLNRMRQDIEVLPSGPEQVSGRTRTVSFILSYTGNSPDSAAGVTNAIAAFYVAQNDRMRSEEAIRTSQFLRAQVEDARKQLYQQEQHMRAYTSRYIGELPQQVGVNLATLERLNTQLRMNGEQQLRAIEQREKLLEGLEDTAAIAGASPGSPEMELLSADVLERMRQIERMKQDLVDMEIRFTSRHPDVVRQRDQIAALERELELQKTREAAARRDREEAQQKAAAPEDPVPPQARRRTLDTLDGELARLKKEEGEIRQAIVNYERRLEAMPERQQEYNLISRDYQAAKDLYDSLLKRAEEAQFAESVETDRQGERFRMLEPALPPAGPTAPNRLRLFILGLLLAAAVAMVAVLAVEQLDTSFHSIDDLRAFTAVPVLVTIPRIGPMPAGRRLRMALATASALATIALAATLSAYVAHGNEDLVRLLERAG